ncbi:MAG: hypothetical protein ACRETO_09600 [Gammaproteobacteria bacterium]
MHGLSKLGLPIFFAAAVLTSPFTSASDFGNVGYYGGYAQPSNVRRHVYSTFYDDIFCYDLDSPHELLDCPFTYSLLGTADVLPSLGFDASGYAVGLELGGHMHTAGRPLFLNVGTQYPFGLTNGILTSQTSNSISGSTDHQLSLVTYSVPEEGGVMAFEVNLTAPSGWFCADYCFTATSWRDISEVDVGFFQRGYASSQLVRVPQSGTDYQVIDISQGHYDQNNYTYGSYLRPDAEQLLLKIAAVYHKITGHQLSVNDMSLPVGGLYDVNDDWAPPHAGHRTGKAADINQTDIGSTEPTTCEQDKALHRAVRKIIGSDQPGWTKLYCETGGRKHINLLAPP